MGNLITRIDGDYTELSSGRTWKLTQAGNTFAMTQEGTNRKATGIAVPLNGGYPWVMFATFDGYTNVRLTPSQDGMQLVSTTETFTRSPASLYQYQPPLTQQPTSTIHNIPALINTIYSDNYGKFWVCVKHEGGNFVLKNQSDQREYICFTVRDEARGVYTVFLTFQIQGQEIIMRVDTSDLTNLSLPNGDTLRNLTQQLIQNPSLLQHPVTQPVSVPGFTNPNQFPIVNQPVVNQTPNVKYYKIGGPTDGTVTWSRWNGQPSTSSSKGFELYFGVDENGNVYGTNKAFGANFRRFTAGTFINGQLNLISRWQDNRMATFSGSVSGNNVSMNYQITAIGSQGGAVGDCGSATGTLVQLQQSPSERKFVELSGKTNWTKYNGVPNNSVSDGWSMSFTVDKFGMITGQNPSGKFIKSYEGVLLNNVMEATVLWEDGRTAKYKGTFTGNTFRIDFEITAVGSQGGCVGDSGFQTGTLKESLLSPEGRTLEISGKSYWTIHNSAPSNLIIDGWNMFCSIDSNGQVTGKQKNVNQKFAKSYYGSITNNVYTGGVKWEDGRDASYKALFSGNNVKMDFTILSPGTQGNNIGDTGYNVGTFQIIHPYFASKKNFELQGKTTWAIYNGAPSSSVVDGWLMSFDVDGFGNVSGKNKNVGATYAKSYTGTFKNNFMNIVARWEDGRVATLKGSCANNNVSISFTIDAVGTQGGCVGDKGYNSGTIKLLYSQP